MKQFIKFVIGSILLVLRGGKLYYAWMALLLFLIVVGAFAYYEQLTVGLIVTSMRDPVSWGFYIGNFTFLVGVAAAAVVLVIPAYIYHWPPIKEIAIIGELLAISAIVMCLLFVAVDIGRPERFLHLFPLVGSPNFPASLLSWDVIVLNLYLVLNLVIATHMLFTSYHGRPYSKRYILPLLLLSIPAAVAIHTVTAFLYAGLSARPYSNSAILAPRFLTSAFCSGPAIILILLQLLRKYWGLAIKDEAIEKIAELMAYAMFINLFLFGAEIFREYYSDTHHLIHYKYLFRGLHGHTSPIAIYAWTSLICSVVAFILFLIPQARKNKVTLNIGAVLIYMGVYVEKGVALVIPGFTPSMVGEIYEYAPSFQEIKVAMGVFSVGFLVFTLMLKVAVPIMLGQVSVGQKVKAFK
jgi:Ni/Fe-hydrogenase subunit HybB-like protein